MEEIWKDIEGYEGLYQVSNLGRVKRLKKEIELFNKETKYKKTVKETILKPTKDGKGYIFEYVEVD